VRQVEIAELLVAAKPWASFWPQNEELRSAECGVRKKPVRRFVQIGVILSHGGYTVWRLRAERLISQAMTENPFKTEGASANSVTQRQPNPRARILVVEDDPLIRQLNSSALTECGYHVGVAEDGAAAWAALQLNSYDLMITGDGMPKVSGVDLLKKLHAAHMALPVIMAAGSLPPEEFTRAPWPHPAATLPKPYTLADLLGTVKEVLQAAANACEKIALPKTGRKRAGFCA
jgi:CheY-like chemotaxis protein